MRIIILTGSNYYQNYFTNTINNSHKIEAVFINGKGTQLSRLKKFFKKYKFNFFKYLKNRKNNIKIDNILYPQSKDEKIMICNQIFSQNYNKINDDIKTYYDETRKQTRNMLETIT